MNSLSINNITTGLPFRPADNFSNMAYPYNFTEFRYNYHDPRMMLPVTEMPPPSHASDDAIRATCGFYLLLFIVGLCGNSGVITVIFCTRESLRKQGENALLYIIALCIVDSLVILSMPMTISHILLGHWMFGGILCNVYWLVESFGKILSTFILTLLSADRYLAVCWPNRPQLRSIKVTVCSLSISVILALLLLSPLPYNAEEIVFKTKVTNLGGTPTRFVIATCHTKKLKENFFKLFITGIFIVGYCIPMICMTVFYGLMLNRLKNLVQAIFGQSQIPLRRITLYTLVVVSFYFVCWTPYWLGVLSYLFFQMPEQSNTFVYLMYVIHALPYVNSALNWIFYALLNTQLRRNCQEELGSTRRPTCSRNTAGNESRVIHNLSASQYRSVTTSKSNGSAAQRSKSTTVYYQPINQSEKLDNMTQTGEKSEEFL